MRQLMDYYFVVKHEKEVKKGLNVQEVKKIVSELGLDCFASALMWILGDVFGLSIELMPWQPCEEDGRIILAEVMQSGNFGKQDARAGAWMIANGRVFGLLLAKHSVSGGLTIGLGFAIMASISQHLEKDKRI